MLTSPLYEYQEEAFSQFISRGNLLVAYEMGLGKTNIALAAAEDLRDTNKIRTCLIVCPANLKWQWAQRIAQFTDCITVEKKMKDQSITVPENYETVVVDGDRTKRSGCYAMVDEFRPKYVVMSYESVVNDWSEVRRIKPDMVVLDEATAIKTFKAQRTKKIKKLTAPYRLALTGTPVENRPEELYSIMQWVDADVLGRYDLFDKSYIVRNNFGGVKRYKNIPVLHQRLRLAMARKSRRDPMVAKYIPKVDSDIWSVYMDTKTEKLYRRMAIDLKGELTKLSPSNGLGSFDVFNHYSGLDESTKAGKVMAIHGAMEMLLDHPDLIGHSALDYADQNIKAGSKYCHDVYTAGLIDDLDHSPKLDYLAEELEMILSWPENKIIIFTKYVNMLHILQDRFQDTQSVLYHGNMNSAEKSAAIAKYESDPHTRLFLSSHAGAYGTDLYMANYLINYDLPWSSGKADQINGRHVRASSDFSSVYIRDMLYNNTIEQRKHEMLNYKRRIGTGILDNVGADNTGRIENDLDSLTTYLDRL